VFDNEVLRICPGIFYFYLSYILVILGMSEI
jgi:hypothetical protein